MRSKRKSHGVIISLVVILMFQLVFPPVANAADMKRTPEAAIDLMVAARGMLLEEDLDDGSAIAGRGRVFSIRKDVSPESPAEQILVRLINATKGELEEIEQACRELKSSFSEPGQECERQLSENYCAQRVEQLRQRLSFLRKVRGDHRKAFTRAWHSVKRGMANLWRQIGPLGRRFLRELSSDVLSVIQSGGSLHGGVLRKLVIKNARAMAENALRDMVKRGIERKILPDDRLVGSACSEAQGAEIQEGDAQDCAAEQWLEDYIEQVVIPALMEDHKYCVDWTPYTGCLYEKAQQGMCVEQAYSACESVYDSIPPNAGAATVTIMNDAVFFRDSDNHFDITFSLNGGSVSGYAFWDFTDDFFGDRSCYVSQSFTFNGTYDPATCILSGMGIHTLDKQERYRGDCLGIGDPFEKSITWRMDLVKGTLNTCAELPSSPLCLLEPISGFVK